MIGKSSTEGHPPFADLVAMLGKDIVVEKEGQPFATGRLTEIVTKESKNVYVYLDYGKQWFEISGLSISLV